MRCAMVCSFGGESSQGHKGHNEDCACYYLAQQGEDLIIFLGVCDGLGGLEHGELASSSVLSSFAGWFQREVPQLAGSCRHMELAKQQWEQLAVRENQRLYSMGHAQHTRMGTAMAALLLWGEDYLLMNVGDVRGYLLRGGLRQITVEQSYVAREVEAGRLSQAEVRHHPYRNILLQCIGAGQSMEPAFSVGKIQMGDTFLLCSDGLCHELWDAEIEALLNSASAAGEALQWGIEELVRRVRQRGEQDDITAVAIKLDMASASKRRGPIWPFGRRRAAAPLIPLQIERSVWLGARPEGSPDAPGGPQR